MKQLLNDYRKRKRYIRKRLRDFKIVYKKSNNNIFEELCFCILTPQAKAVACDRAIKRLKNKDLLFKGSYQRVRACLNDVRFPNNKARYLIAARKVFKNCKGVDIKSKIDHRDVAKTRDWLVRNVKGFGYKEASHFLRNIGLGKDLAILDRHILKNLKRYGLIGKIPESLNKKDYIEIEKRMKEFFDKLGVPIEEVDLLFWSKETGFIFK